MEKLEGWREATIVVVGVNDDHYLTEKLAVN